MGNAGGGGASTATAPTLPSRVVAHNPVDAVRTAMQRVNLMDSFDPAVIAGLRAELPAEDLLAILRTFEADLHRLVAEFVEAARLGDHEAYLQAAHSLAGTASSVGLVGLEHEARIAMDPAQPEPPTTVVPRLTIQASTGLQALRAFTR
jgi:HPt (histidine-containing phosphotransfer) domain-containing protein